MARESLGLVLGFIAVVLFGGTLPFTRLAVEGLDPWFVTAARAALAGILAGAVLLVTRRRRPDVAALKRLALVSLCLVVVFPGVTALAMQRVGAAHGGVMLGLLPLATALFGAWLAGERPGWRFWAAAVAGAAVVVAFALREGTGRLQLGDLLLAAAVLSAGFGYALSGQLTLRLKGWEVISWALVIALPLTFPLMILLAPRNPSVVPHASWTGLAYVTLLSQYFGFFAWNAGLALGGIALVSQVQLLQTFVTLLIAAALNGEQVDALTWMAAVVVVSLVLIGRKAARRPAPRSPPSQGVA
ncbi:MAG TPA: DMT family transporter [Beijerinckiaceae bacterium]|nr:DMT family transporter [Beijerinckiaceae bacterium]